MNHQDIILETEKKELEWFLSEEIPQELNQIRDLVKTSIRRFVLAGYDKDQNTHEIFQAIHNFESNDLINGSFILSGDSIKYIDVKFRTNKSHSFFKVQLSDKKIYCLTQIQECWNYFQVIIELIDEQLNITYDDEVSEEAYFLNLFINKLLLNLLKCLSCLEASDHAVLNEQTINDNYKKLDVSSLNELWVPIVYVQHETMFMVLYCLGHQSKSTSEHTISYQPIEFNGKIYEITNAIETKCFIPWLQEIYTLNLMAIKVCQSIKHKIHSFPNIS